jgi:hypothetical protein
MTVRNLLILAFWAMPAATLGQDMGLSRAVELPAHRMLMETREGAELSPFVTDGCSGGMSTIWRTIAVQFPDFAEMHGPVPPWEACCEAHDMIYHDAGGATTAGKSFDARRAADEALRICVVETGEGELAQMSAAYGVSEEALRQIYRGIGDAMYLAVRFGGGPCSGLPWRWGYGYPGCSFLLGSGASGGKPKDAE